MSNPPWNYNCNRQRLNLWLHEIHNKVQQTNKGMQSISSSIITSEIYNILKQAFKHKTQSNLKEQQEENYSQHQAKQPVTFQQLLEKNDNFRQCLKDYSEDLIYYVYGSNQFRATLPKCLVGYYQLVKNIVSAKPNHEHRNNNQQSSLKATKTLKKAQISNRLSGQIDFPLELKNYSCQRVFRLLLAQAPFSYLRFHMTKLDDSSILAITFYSQLKALIIKRFEYLCKLYLLNFHKNSDIQSKIHQYFLIALLENGDGSNQQEISISIDGIILCMVYGTYRTNRYSILFGDIINAYERECQCIVDRSKILRFYNSQFIIKLFPSQIICHIKITEDVRNDKAIEANKQQRQQNWPHENKTYLDGKDQKKIYPSSKQQSRNNEGFNALQRSQSRMSGFRYQQVKQQKSIFDMFQ